MAEIYTKPFKSVQAAITLFEQKIDPNKCSTGNNKEEKGGVFKDLADPSLLLEANEHEKDLAFFELDASSKSPQELLALLKLYKAERDNYKEKFRKSQALFLEYEKGEHFLHSVRNLEADDESKTAIAQKKDEMMKTEPTAEELNSTELLKHSSEIKKVIFSSKLSNMEAKSHSSAFCSVMEEDLKAEVFLEDRKAEVFQSQIDLEDLRRRLDETEDLENELLKQMIISEYLHMELTQSREAEALTSKAILSAMNELYLSKTENERTEEGRQMKEDLNVSSEKMNGINYQIDMLLNEIHRMQEELSSSKKIKPFESQPIAEDADTEDADTETFENSAFACADPDGFCSGITISVEEYEFLIHKSEMTNPAKSGYEFDELKREVEEQNAEISELRCLLEETERRAEVAEKAKFEVESQLRKWRDQRRQRRAASDAVKEHCAAAAAEKEGGQRQREKPLFSKLACINPELHQGFHSHPKRSLSVQDEGKSSRHLPLGKLLKLKI